MCVYICMCVEICVCACLYLYDINNEKMFMNFKKNKEGSVEVIGGRKWNEEIMQL